MGYSNKFFRALGIIDNVKKDVLEFSKKSGVPADRLHYFNENNVVPSGADLVAVLNTANIDEVFLKLKMGRLDKDLIEAIQLHANEITKLITEYVPTIESPLNPCELKFETKLGKLYQGDSYVLLKAMKNDSIDLVFADPPFNLSKLYPSNIDDNLKEEKYIHWCQEWLSECVRVLKPGGALLVWNLPKWNVAISGFLNNYLSFRNWIAVEMKMGLPIQNRLYPAHYSLLYYVKGEKPTTFHPDKLPMLVCPKCFGDLKDYGGYKDKMNPKGINISDVWTDLAPVRHTKYKRREGSNELSLKLMDRILEMTTNEGDLVFDPFGGSGTTYMAAELKNRKWIGCEIGAPDIIINRFSLIETERKILEMNRANLNMLFTEFTKKNREKKGLWTAESIRLIQKS